MPHPTALLLPVFHLFWNLVLSHKPPALEPLLPSCLRTASHGHLVASVDPDLPADHSERRSRLGKPVVDIRAKCVKRQSPLQVPLGTRYFSAVQPAGDAHFDALCSKSLGAFHRAPHRAAKRDALLELLSDLLGLKLGVQ